MAVPHVILLDSKFVWQQREIEQFRELWEQKLSIYQIAERMKEDSDNIALLAMDQAQKGKIGDGAN